MCSPRLLKKVLKGTLVPSPQTQTPRTAHAPSCRKSQLTRSPGRGRTLALPAVAAGRAAARADDESRKSPAVTADARGGPRRAAPRRRRKLFPARKLPGAAAADRLPSPLRERGGAPSPGGGLAGREGAGRTERRSNRRRGSAGARTLEARGAGARPAALSPGPRTQPRRRRHERARPGVAVPNLPPPFAAAAHRVLCVSLAAALGSLRRSPDS